MGHLLLGQPKGLGDSLPGQALGRRQKVRRKKCR